MAELDELGNLFEAFKVKGNRDKFKAGGTVGVPGVDLNKIRQSVKDRLREYSDDELAFLAKVNAGLLEDGLKVAGASGIAAV